MVRRRRALIPSMTVTSISHTPVCSFSVARVMSMWPAITPTLPNTCTHSIHGHMHELTHYVLKSFSFVLDKHVLHHKSYTIPLFSVNCIDLVRRVHRFWLMYRM